MKAVVSQYKRAMKSGFWNQDSTQAISIAADGTLLDGQHRLTAIAETGLSFSLWVFMNVPKSVITCLDNGAVRSKVDAIRLGYGKEICRQSLSVAGKIEEPFGNTKYSSEELKMIYERHEKAITFAMQCPTARVRHVTDSWYRTVVARAYYTADHGRLMELGDCVRTGLLPNGPSDNGAALLIRYSSEMGAKPSKRIGNSLYYKIEKAITAFLRRDPIKNLSLPREAYELFPLPGETP